MENRIKYFEGNDWADNFYLASITDFMKEFDFGNQLHSLGDIIELYNVLKYLSLPYFENNSTYEIDNLKKEARKTIGYYFSDKRLVDLTEEYNILYRLYIEDFWEIFVDFNLVKKTTVPDLDDFINQNDINIYYLLKQERICDKYSSIIKSHLLKSPSYFEWFIKKYDSDSASDYYFPAKFSNQEINDWARRYCELEEANANYLFQLSNWSAQHEYKINDPIILKAKQAYEKFITQSFEGGAGLSWAIRVSFKKDLKNIFEYKEPDDKLDFEVYFNKNWFDEEQEYPTILNNFIYVFGFLSKFGHFSLISSGYASGSMMDMIATRSKYGYKLSTEFNSKNALYKLVLALYHDYLSYHDIDLEEVLSYCFNILFKEEFNNDNFFFTPSNAKNSYYERSKSLIPEMDSILKQFDLYQQHGEVDAELFELQSKNTSYRDIKSLEDKKYIYFNSNEIKSFCQLIFDNQTTISFPEKKKGAFSFYEYVNVGIQLSDFFEPQQKIIVDLLEKKQIIGYSVVNQIYFKNLQLIKLYKLVWEHGYCSIFYMNNHLLKLIESEVSKGNLKYGNTLFSEQESDYISFVMDNKKYNNGLSIRNKITHGSFAKKKLYQYKEYYLELLMIQILYTLKINEEITYQDVKRSPRLIRC
ncbi:hypothetical protein HB815_08745 [Listeria booriae]|uniref:hypothetical protein n=1 Tax=Listeria booriae TaxID=1552123 RepID=UPI00162388B6|nr:hypothetical protein [Listeria booriae]MBC1211017.1 hypothetical protein [Listeria booriae]